MLSNLTSPYIYARGLGNELVISWAYPTTATSDWVVLLFKGTRSLTTAEATAFTTNPLRPVPTGFTVYETYYPETIVSDFEVINGTDYYYTLLTAIKTSSSSLYSDFSSPSSLVIVHATPATAFNIVTFDGVSLLMKYYENEILPYLGLVKDKDVMLRRSNSPFADGMPTIAISRGNETDYADYIGKFIEDCKVDDDTGVHDYTVSGNLRSLIVTVRFIAKDYNQRENMYLIINALQAKILNDIIGLGRKYGVIDVSCEYQGDFEANDNDITYFGGTFNYFIIYESALLTRNYDIIPVSSITTSPITS